MTNLAKMIDCLIVSVGLINEAERLAETEKLEEERAALRKANVAIKEIRDKHFDQVKTELVTIEDPVRLLERLRLNTSES
jgi:hypothetical protein